MDTRPQKAKVGIFMPAYNQGPYIHEALDSLRAQTFQDFEVRIVDDKSTDGKTPDILTSIDYEKATVHFEEKNLGVNKLTRKHFPKLEGEYVIILCADDKIQPTFLEECVNYLDSHPDKAAVSTWLEYFGDNKGFREYDPDKCNLPDMLIENNFCGSSLVRRAAMESIGWGDSNPSFRLHQDYDRWMSILEKGYTLGIITKPLFLYRIIGTSLSHGSSAEAEMNFKKAFFEKHKDLYEKHLDFVLLHMWEKAIELQHKHREFNEGHEWLDNAYKEATKQVEMKDKRISELAAANEELQARYNELLPYKKYSAYPALRATKRFFTR